MIGCGCCSSTFSKLGNTVSYILLSLLNVRAIHLSLANQGEAGGGSTKQNHFRYLRNVQHWKTVFFLGHICLWLNSTVYFASVNGSVWNSSLEKKVYSGFFYFRENWIGSVQKVCNSFSLVFPSPLLHFLQLLFGFASLFLSFHFETGFLCSPDCPRSRSVDQAGL